MICIYEILYLYNDIVAIRWEDKPTLRNYVESLSIRLAILTRLIYIFILSLILIYFFNIDPRSIMISIALLLQASLIHNLIKIKSKRIYSYTVMRITRILFAPNIILFPHFEYLSKLIVVTLPNLVWDIVGGRDAYIRKYNASISLPETRMSWYIIYSIFLPPQLVMLNFDYRLLAGNIFIITLSLLHVSLRRLKNIKIFP